MEPGATLHHYRIVSRLGEGGMGVVYRAEDTRLGREVALKILRPDLAVNPERLERFEREARAASAINHPGVATLYDIHRDGESVCLAMEFVEGQNLRQLLEGGRFAVPRLLDCLTQVSEALGAAHRKGIVHRDLKPENVMSSEGGFYKILDFGLARMALREDSEGGPLSDLTQRLTLSRNLTAEGQVSGTVAYMSPEQIRGEPVDARSDIFSFGILLYELATGTSPFKQKTLLGTFHDIVHTDPPPISSLRPDAPAEMDRIAAKCLAKDPADRYQTAADLTVDLRRARKESESGSRSVPSALPGTRRPQKREHSLSLARIALIGSFVAGVAVVGIVRWMKTQSRPERLPILPASSVAQPADRSRIAVTFFSDRTGDAASAWLSQGLPEMLITDLARVPGLQLISTQRLQDLLSAAGQEKVASLDARTASQLARYAGAGVVVGGTIFKMGSQYRVDVQAYDTASGRVLTASRVEGTDIFKIADEIGTALKKELRVAPPESGGLQALLTSDPEAYRLYREGMTQYQGARPAEAAKAFRLSLAADPGFPSALLHLGMSLVLSGKQEEGLQWIRKATEHPERLPERERILAEAITSSLLAPGAGKGKGAPGAPAAEFPEDSEGLFWRAEAMSEKEGGRFQAIQILRQAIEKDPNDSLAVAALLRHLEALGLKDDAAAIRSDYQKRAPVPPAFTPPPAAPVPPPPR